MACRAPSGVLLGPGQTEDEHAETGDLAADLLITAAVEVRNRRHSLERSGCRSWHGDPCCPSIEKRIPQAFLSERESLMQVSGSSIPGTFLLGKLVDRMISVLYIHSVLRH